MPPAKTEPRHPIQVVVQRTGLSQHVLRVWERRYGAVGPTRSGSNRRLYSDADLERLRLLQGAIAGGRSIGQVAALPEGELRRLIEEDGMAGKPLAEPLAEPLAKPPSKPLTEPLAELVVEPLAGGPGPVPGSALAEPAEGLAAEHLRHCLNALHRFDAAGFEQALGQASVALGQRSLCEEIFAPLLEIIGQSWRDGSLRVAQEHLASAAISAWLAGMRRGRQPGPLAPVLVLATPARQVHELGALLAAATAASEGWRVVYLGSSLPVEEIALASHRAKARAVALSIVYPPDDPYLGEDLRRLRLGLDAQTPLLVGGAAAGAYQDTLEAIGAHRASRLSDLRALLEELRRPAPEASRLSR